MSYVSAAVRRLVYERAERRCEYCLYSEEFAHESHEVDHIRAVKHRGKSTEDNLCLTCVACNRHKGSDLVSFDPQTDEMVLLFNPRADEWEHHFVVRGAEIIGLTPMGRATVALLQFNTLELVEERQWLIDAGLYP